MVIASVAPCLVQNPCVVERLVQVGESRTALRKIVVYSFTSLDVGFKLYDVKAVPTSESQHMIIASSYLAPK